MQIVPHSWGSPLQEFNNKHEPAGTTVGGRFARKDGAAAAPHAPLQLTAGTSQLQLTAGTSPLLTGSVSGTDSTENGTNVSMIVMLDTEEGPVKAIFKPEAGESWFAMFANQSIRDAVTNLQFSLAEREAAAYEVDQLLGTNVVPETVLREELPGVAVHAREDGLGRSFAGDTPHPAGGSLQRFAEGASDYGYYDDEGAFRVAALDYLTGQMDRHGGNTLWRKDASGRDIPIAIDNGYSFPDKNNIWFRSTAGSRVRGRVIVEGVRAELLQNMKAADWDGFLRRHQNMNGAEKLAFQHRLLRLKEALEEPDGLSNLWDNALNDAGK